MADFKRTTVEKAFLALTSGDDGRVCKDIDEAACNDQPRNFFTHILSLMLTKAADGFVDPKLVLSWLLTQLGASSGMIGLLVPIREAGALLPQLFTAGALRRLPLRKYAWAFGSLVQGVSAGGMALAAMTLDGAAAGWTIVGLLAVLAVARSVCSVTYKDVLGKTVDKSRRGSATGLASSIAAAVVIGFGLILTADIFDRMTLVLAALGVAAGCWLMACALFTTLAEDPGATEGGANPWGVARENLDILTGDRQFQWFIAARGLLTATALAPPFMIALSGREASSGGTQLGLLVIASSLAALLSSYVWGRLADRSSRKVLLFSGIAGALTLSATVGAHQAGLIGHSAVLPALLFGLMVAYQGVRLGRSTHLIDMAEKDKRTIYTALSNTIIGVALLAGGGFSLVADAFGVPAVLAGMAGMSLLGALAASRLDEVQAD